MVVYDGELVIGGFFNMFNGNVFSGLLGWNGTEHHGFPGAFGSLSNRVFDMEELDGDLIVAGNEPTMGHVARWDGTTWHSMGGGLGDRVFALAQSNGVLYAAGNNARVSRWDGTAWQAVGDPFNGRVSALEVHDGFLYAGGAFTQDLSGNVPLNGLARWTGTMWEEVANGLNGQVGALFSAPEGLVVRGDFTSDATGALALPYWTIHDGTTFIEPSFTPGAPDPSVDLPARICAHPQGGFVLSGSPSSIWVKNGEPLPVAFQVRAIVPFGSEVMVAGRGNTLPAPGFPAGTNLGRLYAGVTGAWLDAGGVRAHIDAMYSTFFQDRTNSRAGFEVPKGQGTFTIYSAAPWVLGHHQGELIGSLPSHGLGTEADPPAGPLANEMGSADFVERYFQVWKLDQTTIAQHIAHWNDPSYTMPYAIATWPGNGDMSNGEPPRIAPFADLNDNGLYEPATGEYPLIRGDQAIFHVMHSTANQGLYWAPKMDMDLAAMHYVYSDSMNADLYNTVFTNLRMINRGAQDITNTRFGLFADFDIGCYTDDFAGCDTLQSLFFGYNGDDLDETCSAVPGFGALPPAQGALFLSHTMTAHRAWSDVASGPLAMPFLNDAMNGTLNGGPFMDLGYPTHFQFPGGAWAEMEILADAQDRRSLGSFGAFDFNAGDTMCVDLAFPYARATSGGASASVTALRARAEQLHTWYAAQNGSCDRVPDIHVGVPRRSAPARLVLFPNPATEVLHLDLKDERGPYTITITDATGRVVRHASVVAAGVRALDIGKLAPGAYILRLTNDAGMRAATFVKAAP